MDAKSIFAEALERTDPAERSAFLTQACGDDAELRQRVEALLRAYDQAGSFLEAPPATMDTSEIPPGQWIEPEAFPESPLEGVGSRIGQYKLLQQIGEGGMGIVFMAEQQEPVRRLVALKVVKAGMDTAQVIARFEAERQALAMMDHPNIAKVLDAGSTASGRSYFVMELVKGVPITRYCDEQRLSPRQRLELFVPVCQAIQHAHQKGIIHRDIKPSNVLIAAYDGRPAPKVIDFGVAKAMGGKLTERTLFTGFGSLIGTLEYMSPEQAEFNALDIDTRSDIYSLGVLLYELLTGTTPLTRQRLKDAVIVEVLRLIREEEPPRPSTRLSESKDSLASVSAQRQMEPAGLVKAVRGEVDWIVMKALEKDRTRRYETANGFAQDIQRFLAEEPVEAGPPSATYRLRKLAWKHRRGLATAVALFLLLVAGAIVSSLLAAWAVREQHLAKERLHEATAQKERAENAEGQVREQLEAVQRQKERAEKAETEAKGNEGKARQEQAKAQRSEADAQAVLEFFQDKVLSAGRPEGDQGGLGREVKLIDAILQAEGKIGDSFKDRPVVEASIRDTLGETYSSLGDYPHSLPQFERALALREAHLGTDHPITLGSRNNVALTYHRLGRTAEAIPLEELALKQREAILGPNHLKSLISRNNLAIMYAAAGRIADAVRLHEQNLKQCEAALGTEHETTLNSRNNLVLAYVRVGRIAEAIGLAEQSLKQCEAALGPEHPKTLVARHNLAEAYRTAGRIAEAIRLHEQTLKQREDKLGPEHPATLISRNDLALAYLAAGRIADAIQLHEQTLKKRETKFGLDHPATLLSRNNLAQAYLLAGRADEAARLQEQTVKLCEAKLGPDHPNTLAARNNLAQAYNRAGQFARAEPLLRDSLDQTRKRSGADTPATAARMAALGANLVDQHKYDEAEPILRDCLKIFESKQPNAWATFNAQSVLGGALLGQKKYAEAEPLLLSGYKGMKQRQAKIPVQGKVRLSEALQRLVQLYEATGKKDEADKWRKEQVPAKEKTKPKEEKSS